MENSQIAPGDVVGLGGRRERYEEPHTAYFDGWLAGARLSLLNYFNCQEDEKEDYVLAMKEAYFYAIDVLDGDIDDMEEYRGE